MQTTSTVLVMVILAKLRALVTKISVEEMTYQKWQ